MKINFKPFLILSIVLIGLSSFAQQSNISENQKAACQIETDSMNIELFKKDVEKQIKTNQQKITSLKTGKLNANFKKIKKFNKKIMVLEEKNNELQKRINECVKVKPSLWLSFKNKLIRDMKKLGNSLDNMRVDQYELSQ